MSTDDVDGAPAPVVRSADGVTVTKRLDRELDEKVPTVVYDIEAPVEDPRTVVIEDPAPRELGGDDTAVGFHPEYEIDNWSRLNGGTLVRFEREIAASEETVRTALGVKPNYDEQAVAELEPAVQVDGVDATPPSSDPDADSVSGEPSTTSSGGGAPAAPGHSRETDDVTGDAGDAGEAVGGGTEREGGSVAADAEASADRAEQAAAEAREVAGAADRAAEVAQAAAEDAQSAAVGDVGDGGSVVAAMAEAVEAADESEVAAFRAALGVSDADDGVSESEAAQVEHLSAKLTELEAYIDRMEAFIDENGDAQGLLQSVQRDQQQLEAAVEGIEEDVEGLRAAVGELRGEIEAFQEMRRVLERQDDG